MKHWRSVDAPLELK